VKFYIVLLSWLAIFLVACNNSSIKQSSDVKKEVTISNVKKYNPIRIESELPDVVQEQSGMIWHNDLIWVNNDSGGAPELYGYNLNGVLQQTIHLKNATNLDWEALAEDEEYFYIGDFGNNLGTRKNLKLYKIAKPEFTEESVVNVDANAIHFEWADQKEFLPQKHRHNYDCEAFFSYGDSLYFFTKNRGNLQTRMYVMPKQGREHRLQPKGTFHADLLITGADISSDGKVVALVGYNDFRTYMILFYNFKGADFFNGKHIRLDLSVLGRAQTEGVVFSDKDDLYINTQATKQAQSIYRIDWKQWIKN